MNNKWKVINSFVLGMILGGALVYTGIHFFRHHWTEHGERHHEFKSKRILAKLSKELNLSAQQITQVEKILELGLPKMNALRESVRPQISAIRKSINEEIRAILEPEQQEKFKKIVEDFEMRRKKREERADSGKLK